MLESKHSNLTEEEDNNNNNNNKRNTKTYKWEIVWFKAIGVLVFHFLSLLAAINYVTTSLPLMSMPYFSAIAVLSAMGILCGAHRLWSHRSYKANLPLRVILMILDTIAFQEDILDWSRDHRVHHKFSDTDADPYNSSRGFFFSHMGWVFVRKHADVKAKGKGVDLSDLLADPVVAFQRKYYYRLVLLLWGVIPIGGAMYLFRMSFFDALCCNCLRYVCSLHNTWTVNSFAHLYGMRPYDQSINPRESAIVTYLALGEGYHNYHHVFPYDYSASEFGWKSNWNPATAFIEFFARMGWASDLKKAPQVSIKSRSVRTGDQMAVTGSKPSFYCLLVDYIIGLFSVFNIPIILVLMRIIKNFVF